MKLTTRFLTIGAAMVILFACNKKDDENPKPAPTAPAITVDSLVGRYTGQHETVKTDYAYGMGQTFLRDTTYTTIDTLYVKKISADSFELYSTDWQYPEVSYRFKYNSDNLYRYQGQNHGIGGVEDSVMVQIYPAKDSMVLHKRWGTTGTSAYTRQMHKYFGKMQ